MAGRVDEKSTVFGSTVRLWQTNVSWETIHRTRTPNCFSKGKQYIILYIIYKEWKTTTNKLLLCFKDGQTISNRL